MKNNHGTNTFSNDSSAFTNQQNLKTSTQSIINTEPFKEAEHMQK